MRPCFCVLSEPLKYSLYARVAHRHRYAELHTPFTPCLPRPLCMRDLSSTKCIIDALQPTIIRFGRVITHKLKSIGIDSQRRSKEDRKSNLSRPPLDSKQPTRLARPSLVTRRPENAEGTREWVGQQVLSRKSSRVPVVRISTVNCSLNSLKGTYLFPTNCYCDWLHPVRSAFDSGFRRSSIS